MKRFFSAILLLIISIQCLPIIEMGRCLYNNQFVEEETVRHGIEKRSDIAKELFNDVIRISEPSKSELSFVTVSTRLHTPPVTDITTPPPNA